MTETSTPQLAEDLSDPRTYHLVDEVNTLEKSIIRRHILLDNDRHVLKPRANLGALEILPTEILYNVLEITDLESLTTMRRVNHRTTQLIDSMPKYKAIVKHGIEILRSTLAIEAGAMISSLNLFSALCNPSCENCGDFGGYIYLLTCRRVCYLCFTTDEKYLPMLAVDVRRKFCLDARHLAATTQIRSIDGYYSPDETYYKLRRTLYDRNAAREAGIAQYGTLEEMNSRVNQVQADRMRDYEAKLRSRPHSHPRNPADERRDAGELNAFRFMAVVRAPWLDLLSQQPFQGVYCKGCKEGGPNQQYNKKRQFTTETFEDHIRKCGPVVVNPADPTSYRHLEL